MTAVTYHGEYPAEQLDGDDKPFIEQHGYFFQQGKSTAVKEPELLRKFAGNRFFNVAGQSDKDEVEDGKEEAERAEVATLQAWLTEHQVPFHHRAGLDKLQGLKDDYVSAQEEARD